MMDKNKDEQDSTVTPLLHPVPLFPLLTMQNACLLWLRGVCFPCTSMHDVHGWLSLSVRPFHLFPVHSARARPKERRSSQGTTSKVGNRAERIQSFFLCGLCNENLNMHPNARIIRQWMNVVLVLAQVDLCLLDDPETIEGGGDS